jgi:hypothetical protein
MGDLTTEQVASNVPNPNGIGGFADNPENINHGGRPKNTQRYGYWLQFFKDMKVSDFDAYLTRKPEGEMYLAEAQAYKYMQSVANDYKLWSIVADRTEGRPLQSTNALDIETREPVIVRFINDVPRPDSNKPAII